MAGKKTSQKTAPVSKKIIDDEHHIPVKRGNGILRREVWVDSQGVVTGYNLAYINNALHGGDNGRVLGYDNAHQRHHRHFFGEEQPVTFVSYEDIEERFDREWRDLQATVQQAKKGK